MVNSFSFPESELEHLSSRYNLELSDNELIFTKDMGLDLLGYMELLTAFILSASIPVCLVSYMHIPMETGIAIFVILLIASMIACVKIPPPRFLFEFFEKITSKYYISQNSLSVSHTFSLFKKTKISPLKSIYIDKDECYSNKGELSYSTIKLKAVLENGKHIDFIEYVPDDDAGKLKEIFEKYALFHSMMDVSKSISDKGRELFGNKFFIRNDLQGFVLSVGQPTRWFFAVIIVLSIIFPVALMFLMFFVDITGSWKVVFKHDLYLITYVIVASMLCYSFLRRMTGTEHRIRDGRLSVVEQPFKIKSFDMPVADISEIFYMKQSSKYDDYYILNVKLKDGRVRQFGASSGKKEHIVFLRETLQEYIKDELPKLQSSRHSSI